MNPTPRSAYVHVPFCAHRCGYCNFTLVAKRDDLIGDYLRAIEIELRSLGEPHEIDTLFFGGGTPTHLDPNQFGQLVELVRASFELRSGYEFTVETNPHYPAIWYLPTMGVTRLSIGGQSFDKAKLKTLERDHKPRELSDCVRFGSRGSFSSASLDLIFGVPGETLQTWWHDLKTAIDLGIPHVSTYGLTFEQGTTFWTRREQNKLKPLDEELERQMYALAIDVLTDAGYEHYEVSNFAKPGHRCRHNEAYWAGDGYYAVGPGAARYVNGRREMNHRSVTTWLKRVLAGESPVAEFEELDSEDRAREMLVFGLRRLDGVDRDDFLTRSGHELDSLAGESLNLFVDQGLLADDGNRVRLTRNGLFVSDSIWPYFLRQ